MIRLTATDLFSGAGGSSEGLRQAGWDVRVCANHWPVAVATHALNHPDAEHFTADLSDVDWRRFPTTDYAAIRAVGMNDAGKAAVVQSGAGKNTPEVQRLAREAKAALAGYYREFLTGATRNRRDVWTIPTEGFPRAHFATFPVALPERCILAGCKPGGTVLDPFSGSGTTGLAAAKHGRRYVGIDLNADYLDLSLRTRLAQPGLDLDGVGA